MNKSQIVAQELSQITTHKAYAELRAKENLLLLRNNPDFAKIDSEIRTHKINLSKTSNPKEIEKLRKQISKLQEKQDNLLKKLGILPTDLTPKYACGNCNDSGYVNGEICDCLKLKVKKALAKQSGLSNRLKYSFATSNPQILEQNESLAKAYAVAKKYVEVFPCFEFPNLTFVGNVGAGKTYLIECIANALIQKSQYVVFSTAFDLNRTIQNSFGVGTLEREAMLAPFFESDLLIIDDLGSEPIIKNVTIANLFSVINERQSHNLPIIISTNLDIEEVQERYGDRIASRIFNRRTNLIIPFLGKDLRIN